MGDWLGPLSNSIMMALIPLCVLPWCQCAHTKPDPTHPISYWTVIYISTALCSVLGKSLNACWTLVTALDAALIAHYIQCWHVMTHYLTAITGRGQTRGLTQHSAPGNYVVTRNGTLWWMQISCIIRSCFTKGYHCSYCNVVNSSLINHALI